MLPDAVLGELASARCEIGRDHHNRIKGRNGWFVPRRFDADVRRDTDGSLLIAIRQYSRRMPAGVEAPSEWIMTLAAYLHLAEAVGAAIDAALGADGL